MQDENFQNKLLQSLAAQRNALADWQASALARASVLEEENTALKAKIAELEKG